MPYTRCCHQGSVQFYKAGLDSIFPWSFCAYFPCHKEGGSLVYFGTITPTDLISKQPNVTYFTPVPSI